ncbi:Hypp4301 [Branchiostoma lanceolatum]|uniref:Hypp4301 protein n=1 Tax=Branchiostoma lanceolatum TaxID=7740 RepID=A0A8K0EXM1_BRALA|nr:Hypp4301 [Branchiostoma lanceolatum]
MAHESDIAYLDYIRGDPRDRFLTNALITCSDEVDFNYDPPTKKTFTSSWKDSVAGWGSVPPNTFSLPYGIRKRKPRVKLEHVSATESSDFEAEPSPRRLSKVASNGAKKGSDPNSVEKTRTRTEENPRDNKTNSPTGKQKAKKNYLKAYAKKGKIRRFKIPMEKGNRTKRTLKLQVTDITEDMTETKAEEREVEFQKSRRAGQAKPKPQAQNPDPTERLAKSLVEHRLPQLEKQLQQDVRMLESLRSRAGQRKPRLVSERSFVPMETAQVAVRYEETTPDKPVRTFAALIRKPPAIHHVTNSNKTKTSSTSTGENPPPHNNNNNNNNADVKSKSLPEPTLKPLEKITPALRRAQDDNAALSVIRYTDELGHVHTIPRTRSPSFIKLERKIALGLDEDKTAALYKEVRDKDIAVSPGVINASTGVTSVSKWTFKEYPPYSELKAKKEKEKSKYLNKAIKDKASMGGNSVYQVKSVGGGFRTKGHAERPPDIARRAAIEKIHVPARRMIPHVSGSKVTVFVPIISNRIL